MGTFKELLIEQSTGDTNLSFEKREMSNPPVIPSQNFEVSEVFEKDIFTLDIFGDSHDGDAQFFKIW